MSAEDEVRTDLISEYFTYCNILDQQGRVYSPKELGDLSSMPLHELKALVRRVRDIARTPVS